MGPESWASSPGAVSLCLVPDMPAGSVSNGTGGLLHSAGLGETLGRWTEQPGDTFRIRF